MHSYDEFGKRRSIIKAEMRSVPLCVPACGWICVCACGQWMAMTNYVFHLPNSGLLFFDYRHTVAPNLASGDGLKGCLMTAKTMCMVGAALVVACYLA